MTRIRHFRNRGFRGRRLSALLAVPVLLAGCAVGPNFHRPTPPTVTSYVRPPPPGPASGAEQAQRFIAGADIPAQWWTLFQSPALNRLIEKALKDNPDLASAKAALKAARETYLAQRGGYLPTLDAGYGYTLQQASGTLAPPLASGSDLYSLHTAQLTVGYAPDVFGGIRRQTETVAAQTEAQRFETEATYLTLTSNVAAAAIQEASLRDQLEAARAAVKAEADILEIMRRQRGVGQIGGGDVAAQEAALAQAEQALPPLQKQFAQQRDLLADLTGRFPSEASPDEITLADLTLPRALPVSLPSTLVEHRPDVRVAEANLHAASAQVGVAIANRLPSFQLSATAGGAATTIAHLFDQGNGFWSLGATVAQPIFEGGSLLHRQKAAEASLVQAKAQYRSTVLSAFQNVADVLQALEADTLALTAAERAERSARTSLDIARKQLEVGDASGLAVLNAEQAYQQALSGLVQAKSSRMTDTVALFQALGGGWWNNAPDS